MTKWQKISLALGALLLLSCLALFGLGALWFATSGGSNLLAQLTGASAVPTAAPLDTPAPFPRPSGQNNPGGTVPAAVGSFGIVQSIDGSTVKVAGARGNSQTLELGSQTRVIIAGQPGATAGQIQAGDRLLALGTRSGSNGIQPRAVIVAPAAYGQENIKLGTVQSSSPQSITVTAGTGNLTVELDSKSQVLTQTLNSVNPSRIQPNSQVVVIGQPSGEGSFKADIVLVRGAAAGGRQTRPNPAGPTPAPTQTQ